METLAPIPSPPRHWWDQFRQRLLPVLVFLGGVMASAFLWRHQGGGRTFVAVGDGARASVLAPQPGSIVEVLVPDYAEVRAGQPLAVLRVFDPRGEIDRARLQLERARLAAAPSLADASAVDLERLRLDLARIRSELATARVRLDFATREVNRIEPLFRDRLLAEDTYELSRQTRETNAAEVREKEQLMAEVEARMRELEIRQALAAQAGVGPGPGTGPETGEGTNGVRTVLTAPIHGTVGAWLRQSGEFVVEGETLVQIQARRAERVVGYLRQPIGFDPRVGMPVRVARRTLSRERFDSEIRHVGAHFETITNALAFIRDGVLLDVGLPVVVEVPADQWIRPGEVVDVVVVGAAKGTAPVLGAGGRP